MGHPIAEHSLPGVADGRRRRLAAAGIHTLEELVSAGADTVAAIPHIHPALAERVIAAAQELLDQLAPAAPEPAEAPAEPTDAIEEPVAPEAPEVPEGSAPVPGADAGEDADTDTDEEEAPAAVAEQAAAPRKAKKAKKKASPRVSGKAAKRLKAARALADAARKHAKGGKGAPKRKARRELARLDQALRAARKLARKEGLRPKRWAALEGALAPLEKALKALVKKAPSPARLKEARKQARRARAAAEAI